MTPQDHETIAIRNWQQRTQIHNWEAAVAHELEAGAALCAPGLAFKHPTGWEAAWLAFAATASDRFTAAWNKACFRASHGLPLNACITEILTEFNADIDHINEALQAVQPTAEIGHCFTSRPRSDRQSPIGKIITPQTWKHYGPVLDPERTIRNLTNGPIHEVVSQFPQTTKWARAAGRFVKQQLKKLKHERRHRLASALITVYPLVWTALDDEMKKEFPGAEWLKYTAEEIPDDVINAFAGTGFVPYLRNREGNWVKTAEVNAARRQNVKNLWEPRQFTARHHTLSIDAQTIKTETGQIQALRIGPTTALITDKSTVEAYAIEVQGIEVISLYDLTQHSGGLSTYVPLPTTCKRNPVAFALEHHAPAIISAMVKLQVLGKILNDTDNPEIQHAAVEILGLGLKIHAKALNSIIEEPQPNNLIQSQLLEFRTALKYYPDPAALSLPPAVLALLL